MTSPVNSSGVNPSVNDINTENASKIDADLAYNALMAAMSEIAIHAGDSDGSQSSGGGASTDPAELVKASNAQSPINIFTQNNTDTAGTGT